MLINIKHQIKNKNTNDKITCDKITWFFMVLSIALIFVFSIQFFLYWFLVKPINPLNIPLFWPDKKDTFMDFFNVNNFVSDPANDPYRIEGSNYPPLALLVAKFFGLFSSYKVDAKSVRISMGGIISAIIFLLVAIVPLFLLLKKYTKNNDKTMKETLLLAGIFLFSAPMLFLLQRGNYLILVLVFTAVFLIFRNDKNKFIREFSYISLAFAAGMKLYPAVFALILLKEKKYTALIKTTLYTLTLLVVPFLFFKGGFSNIPVFLENLLSFSSNSVILDDLRIQRECSFNLSANNMLILFTWCFLKFTAGRPPNWLFTAATIFTLIILFILIFAAFFAEKQWKTSAACALIIILIPDPSFVYTVIFLILPCVAFIADKNKTKKDWLYLILFLLIFSSIQYGYLPYRAGTHGFTYANFIQGMALLIFVAALTADSAKNLINNRFLRKNNTNKEVSHD